MLRAQQIRFAYPNGDCALRVNEFTVQPSESVGIAGPSGAGKTTFLRLLAGLLTPRQGTISIDGREQNTLHESTRRKARLHSCGLVFQDFELLDYLTVEDNVLLPMRLAGAVSSALRERASNLIATLDLAHHEKRITSELSQGERQRVAIVRALVHQPRVVLADEPTSALDEKRRDRAVDLLTSYAKQNNAALVLVSHDDAILKRMDRVVNMEDWKT